MVEELEEIFSDILDIPDTDITEELSPQTFAKWNSMAHMKLVMAMEDAFAVTFTVDEVKSMTSFADTRALLVQKGVE